MTLVDQSRVNELRELGGYEFVTDLWRAYLDICAVEIPRLETALRSGETKTSASLAHLIRSASGNVGAQALHEVCTSIETTLQSGSLNFSSFANQLTSIYKLMLACESLEAVMHGR